MQSMWKYKCPRCREGDLFTKPFNLKKPIEMHERCSCCGLKYEAEPGYFFGAMFISYIWTGFACLFIIGLCLLVFKLSVNVSFAILIAAMVLSYFMILRISRSMYIHFDVKYDKNFTKLEKG